MRPFSLTNDLLQVLRVPMTDEEREKFLRYARELIGRKYDVVR